MSDAHRDPIDPTGDTRPDAALPEAALSGGAGTGGERARVRALIAAYERVCEQVAALEARGIAVLGELARIAQAQTERMVSTESRMREMPWRSIAADVAVAVRMNDRTVQHRLGDALQLTRDFPASLTALAAGRVSRRHVDAIHDAGAVIDDPAARAAFEHVVLGHAETHTPAQTRAFARLLADRINPRSIQERHTTAHAQRLVTVTELHDGMAELRALLPTAIAFGIRDRLTQQAKALKTTHTPRTTTTDTAAGADTAGPGTTDTGMRATPGTATGMGATTDTAAPESAAPESAAPETAARGTGADAATEHAATEHAAAHPTAEEHVTEEDAAEGHVAEEHVTDERTLDQIRADLLADMLLTGAPAIDPTGHTLPGGLGAIRATVQITVPVTTLTGTTTTGAVLDGHSPIDPDTARRLTGDAPGWDRVMTHPVTGAVLTVDRYTPTAEQKRFLRARDQHCRFPGCRTPARKCDIDHTLDAAKGGKTRTCNLACLCKRHHTLKHATEWTVHQLPDGTLEWTTPTGRRIRCGLPPHPTFTPDPDPTPIFNTNPPPF